MPTILGANAVGAELSFEQAVLARENIIRCQLFRDAPKAQVDYVAESLKAPISLLDTAKNSES